MPFIQPDIYQPQLPPTEAQDLLNNLLEQVQYTDERDDFLNLIRKIESDNNPMASPGTTTAKGVYQFTDKSVETAKNRAINLGLDKGVINLISSDPRQWTDDEADIMAISNMFAQSKVRTGFVDDLLVDAFSGNRESMQDAYYRLHHTAPDKATKERVKDIMPMIGPLNKYNY